MELYDDPDSSDSPAIKRDKAIKLLLRCKKMFDARAHVKRILIMVIKKERDIDSWLYGPNKAHPSHQN